MDQETSLENVHTDDDIFIEFDDDDYEPPETIFRLDSAEDVALVKQATQPFLSSSVGDNFLKGCKWSPDGSCVLTNSEDKVLRLFNLPDEFYKQPFEARPQDEMSPILSMKESELVCDYCWYPRMSSLEPSTCFFLTTSRNNPIHLWDAYTGKITSTFSPYSHLDELVSAFSLCFSPDGEKIYAGFKKSIKIFNTAIPGRACDERLTYVEKSGQHGIISCIAVNPRKSSIYALGSYTKQIGLYEEPNGDPICILLGHKGGVTHMKFSQDGTKIFSGGRKDPEILCWDLRKVGTILYSMQRTINTNQRVYFDVNSDGNYLVSGSDDGLVLIWDLKNGSVQNGVLEVSRSFQAYSTSSNGVSWHPTLPLLATSSGQRKWPNLTDSDDEDHFFQKTKELDPNFLSFWWLPMEDHSSDKES